MQDPPSEIVADWIDSRLSWDASFEALRAHRLHLAAARLWQRDGLAVPAPWRAEQRAAALRAIAAKPVLAKVRAAYDGSLMLMKGPEVAACYPVASDRPFGDLDLVADDAPAAQAALLAAGFVELAEPDNYDEHQHLSPLAWPGIPLAVEIHRRPNQPPWLNSVPSKRLFELTVPSATGVQGLLAPEPAAHAVLLVAHSWAHEPLGRLGDLLDVAAVLTGADRERATTLAREWAWERMWRTTLSAIEAVLGKRHRSRLSLLAWTRHLSVPRERTVLERHITRMVAPASSLPLADVPSAIFDVMNQTFAPGDGETWTTQARRSSLALAHAFSNGSRHDRSLLNRGLAGRGVS